jgi:hypothetical protein
VLPVDVKVALPPLVVIVPAALPSINTVADAAEEAE